MKKPSLNELGFFMDHSHNMPIFTAISVFIDQIC